MMDNPFLLPLEEKQEYSWEDYIEIQSLLEEKKTCLEALLQDLYPVQGMRTSAEEMHRRCMRGLTQHLVDPNNQETPIIQHFTVGTGGDCCFVCCTPLGNDRCQHSQTIIESLEKVGFNGHFLLLNGGFPNPSGIEMKYVGVPYSFKIFMMLEAEKRGFQKVIWIDAACYAVNHPQHLFDHLTNHDAVFRWFPPNIFQTNTCDNIVYPIIVDQFNQCFERDIRNDKNVNSIVFGLNFASDKIQEWIKKYYQMVEKGWPFLSSFPEEIVFTALFNSPEYEYVFSPLESWHKQLYINEHYLSAETASQHGYYFLQRIYS